MGEPAFNLVESVADLPRRVAAAGEVVIEQGQAPGPVYVLIEGGVLVERNGVVLVRLTTPGAIFGEMSTLMGSPATATVRAEVASTFALADDGEAFLSTRPGVALAMARSLASRLDNLSGYLAEVKRQFAGQSGHLGMLDEVLESLMNHHPRAVRPGSSRMPEVDY